MKITKQAQKAFMISISGVINHLEPIFKYSEDWDDFPLNKIQYDTLLDAQNVLLDIGWKIKNMKVSK